MADHVRLVRGSTVTPVAHRWYWRHWLGAGKLELLVGTKGDGKSTLFAEMAARLSCGGTWPDGTPISEPGSTLVWSSEDAFDDTILPRYLAAGGDPDRLYHVAGMFNGNGEERFFDPATDMYQLQQEAAGIPDLRLLGVDPVVSAVIGDGNTNTKVRQSLQPLVNFAVTHRCTTLGITHFNKDSEGKSILDRINGSLAYGAVARLIMATVAGQDKKPNRLVRAYSNIAPLGGGFEYQIEQVDLPVNGHSIETQRIRWGTDLSGSPEALMAMAQDRKINQAKRWLLAILKDGPMLQTEIEKMRTGTGQDFSPGTLRIAKKELLIAAEKTSDGWMWRITDKLPRAGAVR